jgi:DNA repair exonuclease SbcCD ATPase subunit
LYRLKYFECDNFIGIYNGLSKKKITLDLTKFRDKSVFIILGANTKGKSTLLSILHPFSGTTDKRDKFIREGKEGCKLLVYEDIYDEDRQLKIKHVYIPSKPVPDKVGTHATKSYIFKIENGEEKDLNPNGNVSSFLLAIDQEFGIDEDFLRLSTQNEDMVGLVKMTGANRKDHIYKFVPKADDTMVYQKIVNRKHRDVKSYLTSIVDKLGKMDDEVTVKERLNDIESITNELVEKRDKTIGKINKYQAELEAIDPNGKLESEYKEIKSSLKDLEKSQDKLLSKLESMRDNFNIESLVECDKRLNEIISNRNKIWEQLVDLRSRLSAKKYMKSTLYDQITEKESFLNQISGDYSKSDLEKLLDEYVEKIKTFDTRTKKLNSSLTADDLKQGINIIETLREFMIDVYNNCDSPPMLKEAIESIFTNKIESRYAETKEKHDKIKDKVENLTSNITKLSAYDYLKDSVNKRPKDCIIDSCEFLLDYHKWIQIDKKIKQFETDLGDIDREYKDLMDKVERYAEMISVKSKVENLINIYKTQYYLISKLPFNDSFSTQEKILKILEKYRSIDPVENDYYDLIEILQDKDEYEGIKNIKIPKIKIELEKFDTNKNMLDIIKSDLKSLNIKHEEALKEIKKEDKDLEELEESFEEYESKQEVLTEARELFVKLQDGKEEIIKLSDKFDVIKNSTSRIDELNEKIDERKQKLKIVDHKLKPLTEERDKYKYQEIRIKEYNLEREVLEENLKILTVIRKALSTNEGMAVSLLNMYVDEIRRTANLLLSETFDGTLHLHPFNIDEKEFAIPFSHNGEIVDDISKGSTSEKAFISTCLSMSLIEQVISAYGILGLDEVDAGFSEQNKAVYCNILMKQIKRVGISQVYMITHARQYYENHKDSVCFILFPEHGIEKFDPNNMIKIA